MVPGARIELALCYQNRILSPARLPVPPPRRGLIVYRRRRGRQAARSGCSRQPCIRGAATTPDLECGGLPPLIGYRGARESGSRLPGSQGLRPVWCGEPLYLECGGLPPLCGDGSGRAAW